LVYFLLGGFLMLKFRLLLPLFAGGLLIVSGGGAAEGAAPDDRPFPFAIPGGFARIAGSLMLSCSLKIMQKSPTRCISPFFPEYKVSEFLQRLA
jgi:hypothetical protein